MNKFRGAHYLLGLALLFGVSGGLFGGQAVLADQITSQGTVVPAPGDDEPLPVDAGEEAVEIFSGYPILQNTVGNVFQFEVTLYYEGDEARTFDLGFIVPEDWGGIFTGGYPETEISAFTVRPGKTGEKISLTVGPLSEEAAVPGEYVITVNAASGDIKGSVDLKAVVIPAPEQYLLYMSTDTLATEFSVTPDQDNHLSLQLTNGHSGRVDNIIFSSGNPDGWELTFTPSNISVLEPGVTQEIDVIVRPPAGTEAGDYPLILKAVGDQTETERDLRITVTSSAVGGIVGVIVVIAVIVVLAIWFKRSGNRSGESAVRMYSNFQSC